MNKCKIKIINRLNRLEGQFKGIKKMITEENDCLKLVTQLLAIRSATNSLIGLVLMESYKDLLNSDCDNKEEQLEKIEKLILKK